nr:MAG TPA: hypothetical protein [Caudoviricetes sp.]
MTLLCFFCFKILFQFIGGVYIRGWVLYQA